MTLVNRLAEVAKIPLGLRNKRATRVEASVKRGAAHLDKVKPDWYTRVNHESLDMSNPFLWVAAQVAGREYTQAEDDLDIWLTRGPGRVSGGFVAPADLYFEGYEGSLSSLENAYYALMQEYWLAEVEKRLNLFTTKHDPEQVNQKEET